MCEIMYNYSLFIIIGISFLLLTIDYYVRTFKASKYLIKEDELIPRYVELERLRKKYKGDSNNE